MAKCKYCGRGGWLSSTDSNGLCSNCAPAVTSHISSAARVVVESLKLAQEGKTFKTRLSRCDVLIERAGDLIQYEERGIPTIEPAPSTIVTESHQLRDEIILEAANAVAEQARDKADLAATARAKSSALGAAYLKAKEILSESNSDRFGIDLLQKLKQASHQATLDGFLEAARKAEFKGNSKKAMDQYQEALFFIKNDDIPDSQQITEIREIEQALKRLEGAG